jgi:hypothetical protein
MPFWDAHARPWQARVIDVQVHGDKILVALRVYQLSEHGEERAARDRFEVLSCTASRIAGIRGFDERYEALDRVGLAS